MTWLFALALAARGGDHEADAPRAAIGPRGLAIPEGPPVDIRVASGASVQAAVDAATPGSRLILAPGTYREHVVIDRALELSGEPGAVLDGGGVGTVLAVAVPDVVVHDLRITGGGDQRQSDDAGLALSNADRFHVYRVAVDHIYLGFDVLSSDHGVLEDCSVLGDTARAFGMRGDGIRLWESDENVVRNNHLVHVRDLVFWYAEKNEIVGNLVESSRYGTHLMHASGNHIADNRYLHDVVGVFVMYSADLVLERNTVAGSHGEAGVGFGFKESDRITVRDNALVDDTTAIYLDTTPHDQDGVTLFQHNLIGANDVGVRLHGPSQGALFSENDFRANRNAATVDGHANLGKVHFEGNRWSSYAGYDLDGDGWGDLPYEAREVTGRLVERRPTLAYFDGTPAAALLELFAAAFPMFAPAPILVDARPRVGPWPTAPQELP